MSEITSYLKFKGGLIPTIHKFYQHKTYYGLLEGVPNSAINAEMLESIKEEAKRLLSIKNVYLLVPEEIIIMPNSPVETARNGKKTYRALLPKIVCIAELSSKPVNDQTKEWSRLGLIWFQNEYAFPVPESILDEIKLLNWETLSQDEYY